MIIRKIWEEKESEKQKGKTLINKNETETIALGYVSVCKGNSTDIGLHDDEEEIYVILKGRGILTVGDEEQEIGPGSVAYVPRNSIHKMLCISNEILEYLYFANWPK